MRNLQVTDPTTSTLNVRWLPPEGNVREYIVIWVPTAGGEQDVVRMWKFLLTLITLKILVGKKPVQSAPVCVKLDLWWIKVRSLVFKGRSGCHVSRSYFSLLALTVVSSQRCEVVSKAVTHQSVLVLGKVVRSRYQKMKTTRWCCCLFKKKRCFLANNGKHLTEKWDLLSQEKVWLFSVKLWWYLV